MKKQLPCGSQGFATKEGCEIECVGMYYIKINFAQTEQNYRFRI